ncbi:MAG TPA: AAA family ATPase [Planctomycetaceae bacterium]|nr:AAA family ATPase [Planctomycetaceae bacterium]
MIPPDIDYRQALESRVVGQTAAVDAVAGELQLIKAGLVDPGKPASVLLFAGMTGVGKTELARRVAELYSGTRKLNVYTMGNFSEPHSVSAIIGVSLSRRNAIEARFSLAVRNFRRSTPCVAQHTRLW